MRRNTVLPQDVLPVDLISLPARKSPLLPQSSPPFVDARYPTSVAGAVAELKARGLNINEDNFALFCDLDSLQRVGRSYLLPPKHQANKTRNNTSLAHAEACARSPIRADIPREDTRSCSTGTQRFRR
jgi:hypothetical protein